MDKINFEKEATPIIQRSLKTAKNLAEAYYESDEYLNDVLKKNALRNRPQHREAAKTAILSLNEISTNLHPKKSGLPVIQMPANAFNVSSETSELMYQIKSNKDKLIKHLCHYYGITPPESQSMLTDGNAMRDLIVFLAADKLNEPLKKRPQGRRRNSKIATEYREQRDAAFAYYVDEIKHTLKDKISDEAVIETIIRCAMEQTPFGKQCRGFRNFYIRVKGKAYEIRSIKNRISKARRQNK